jgi:hypothetical protein
MYILLFCFLSIITAIFLSFKERLRAGANFNSLFESRFFEIFSLRSLLIVLELALIEGLCLFACKAYVKSDAWFLIGTVICGGFAWALWYYLLAISERIAPTVNLSDASFADTINPDELSTLGKERFPNIISEEINKDNQVRWLVAGVGYLGAIVLGYNLYQNNLSAVQGATNPLVQEAASFSLWATGLVFLFSLFANRDYTFVPFRSMIITQGMLLISAILASLTIGSSVFSHAFFGYYAIAVGFTALAIRMSHDIKSFYGYQSERSVSDPIATGLRHIMPYIGRIVEHPDYRFPMLSIPEIEARIAKGCVNVEEKGMFVVRNFARFMNIAEVEKQDFTIAMTRFLTVSRGVSLGGGFGTYEGLYYPKVPMWDTDQFPLYPPADKGDNGFRNMADPLTLGSYWDVVLICGGCGGSGLVWETYYDTEYYTEYYTDSQGYQQSRQSSRQVQKSRQVPCSPCSGCGKLKHSQILTTYWQVLIPSITSPEMPMPEFARNAEERIFFRQLFYDNSNYVAEHPFTDGLHNDLVFEMSNTAKSLASSPIFEINKRRVEELHNGYLYRSDFVVAGFRTVRTVFTNLKGSSGWFFGKRPEFYFPQLPLCYFTIATWVFLPPLAMALFFTIYKLISS